MSRQAVGPRGRIGILCCVTLLVLPASGCMQDSGDVEQAQTQQPGEVPAVVQQDSTGEPTEALSTAADPGVPNADMAEDLAAGNLPLRFPSAAAESTSRPDDVPATAAPQSGGGLLGVLRQTIDMSPIFEETGVQDGLSDTLSAADDVLTHQKRQNSLALREANRQVRVGVARRSPHLVLISVEGLGYGDLGCYGQRAYATPNLDRLAARGLRFTNFYAGSADPRASRWCLMTGLNTGRAAPVGSERFAIPSSGSNKVLSDVLWDAGYATGLIGVWDDRVTPVACGYDEWSGFPAADGAFDAWPEVVYLDGTRAKLQGNANGQHGVHATNLLLQESLSFLGRHVSEDRPCFLHVALPTFEDASDDNAADMPATVAELDKLVGGITDWLDKRELAGETCVMVMGVAAPRMDRADEIERFGRTGGLQVRDSGLSEGNLRVPLIVCWEGRITAGESSDYVCAAWDVLPTLADLASAMRRPQRLDGLSLAGALLGRTQAEHPLLYWETRQHGFGQAVRSGNWKGVRLPRQTELALFDLSTDPAEQHNLADERPDVVKQLVVRD